MLSANRKLYDERYYDTVYAVNLSDETSVELRENGRDERVTYEERIDYI